MLIQLLDNLPSQVHMYLEHDAENTRIILLQAGVYAASELLRKFPGAHICAIENDWFAAGLHAIDEVELLSYDKWVALCGEYKPVVTIQH